MTTSRYVSEDQRTRRTVVRSVKVDELEWSAFRRACERNGTNLSAMMRTFARLYAAGRIRQDGRGGLQVIGPSSGSAQ